jgi:PhnB protein
MPDLIVAKSAENRTMRHADATADSGVPQTPETAARILHARLMGGDAPPQFAAKPQDFCVSIMIDDPMEAESVFRELGEGGVIQMPIGQMPIGETFWAHQLGMLTDKFGTP